MQLRDALSLIAALEQHLGEREPAQRLEIGAAYLDREAQRALLRLQRAHQILAQHRFPSLEVAVEHLAQAPGVGGERLELFCDARRRVEITRAERRAVAVHQKLEGPGMHAGGARRFQACPHRLQARFVLRGQHAIHRLEVLQRDARERRHAARAGHAARELDELLGALIKTGPHERERAQQCNEHLQVGLGRVVRASERALDPLLDVAPLRLAQREREDHAAGDARLDAR